ncbi:MAG: hypothetical protein CL961_00190 [Euryarchaeota archaeon]|nr:hypothetical protein [Euryarchaeota archaeon]|tara:strand:- start:1280 stop:1567 length:288 start_codon:yes stop_codon:yes gene_type:complete
MTLALNGLPPFTRLVGWWEGANNNQRHLGMYIPKMGIASPRRKNAKYYYVQVFGKSREGYELPLGKARFHIDQVSKGDNVTVPVLSPYHGKEGTM